MKKVSFSRSFIVLTVSVALIAGGSLFAAQAWAGDRVELVKYDKKGDLVRPEGYREWVFVGTPVTPNELNNGKAAFPEFHNVYIHPKAYKKYKKTGKFPDGTIFVKELVSVGAKSATSGNGYFQGEFIGLEAEVKDSKKFPNEPGYWAFFSFSTKDHKSLTATATAFPTASCNSCHEDAADEDWIFSQYYPVLRAAKMSAGK